MNYKDLHILGLYQGSSWCVRYCNEFLCILHTAAALKLPAFGFSPRLLIKRNCVQFHDKSCEGGLRHSYVFVVNIVKQCYYT